MYGESNSFKIDNTLAQDPARRNAIHVSYEQNTMSRLNYYNVSTALDVATSASMNLRNETEVPS